MSGPTPWEHRFGHVLADIRFCRFSPAARTNLGLLENLRLGARVVSASSWATSLAAIVGAGPRTSSRGAEAWDCGGVLGESRLAAVGAVDGGVLAEIRWEGFAAPKSTT